MMMSFTTNLPLPDKMENRDQLPLEAERMFRVL